MAAIEESARADECIALAIAQNLQAQKLIARARDYGLAETPWVAEAMTASKAFAKSLGQLRLDDGSPRASPKAATASKTATQTVKGTRATAKA